MSLPGFEYRRVPVNGVTVNVALKGRGEPLLLLHGYPQTHHMWRFVAPALAEDFAVVCPDLRGYGDSDKPEGGVDHMAYSKRTLARDMLELMAALGHQRFSLAGHDRGGAWPTVSRWIIRKRSSAYRCSISFRRRPSTSTAE